LSSSRAAGADRAPPRPRRGEPVPRHRAGREPGPPRRVDQSSRRAFIAAAPGASSRTWPICRRRCRRCARRRHSRPEITSGDPGRRANRSPPRRAVAPSCVPRYRSRRPFARWMRTRRSPGMPLRNPCRTKTSYGPIRGRPLCMMRVSPASEISSG
jgi:hypothetical protein